MDKYTIYQDRQGGEFVYWTYSDGATVYLPPVFVARERDLGRARIIKTAEARTYRS